VVIRLFAGAAAAAHVRETTVTAGSIAEVRRALIESFGEDMRAVLAVSSLLIDGVVIPPSIKDKDLDELEVAASGPLVIDVLPPYAGG
jgi:hypothetical protein